jgi:UDP-2,3-diacylglucosamine hydrolase
MILENNTIFIADAHCNYTRTNLFDLLLQIQQNKIKANTIFFVGDIFDFLSDEIDYFKSINQDIINLINQLSATISIVYLEGNHDFNLSRIFPKVQVVSRQMQPYILSFGTKQIALSHGDLNMPFLYELYTKIIRNHQILRLINFFDKGFFISKYIEQKLIKKDICKKYNNFEDIIQNKIKLYHTDLIIEGHYHQGIIKEKYINIPAFACTKQYLYFSNNQFSFNIV